MTSGTSITNIDYLSGYQYRQLGTGTVVLDFFPHAEGYVSNTVVSGVNNYNYVFNYTDHLGNIRLSYTKDPNSEELTILEENNYYPFGLKHNNYNWDKKFYDAVTSRQIRIRPTPRLNYQYKYNGKEFQDELGLNMYDYGARNYDPALGRWMNIDPKAEADKRWSPYRYAYDNPLRFIDPDGMLEGDYFSQTGQYLGNDKIDDGKVYVSTGDQDTYMTATKTEVPGGVASLGSIKTALKLQSQPNLNHDIPDKKGGLHEVRFDIDLDGNTTTYTNGGNVSVDSNNIATGGISSWDTRNLDSSKSDIVGHTHPTESFVANDKAFTFTATNPSDADIKDFKSHSVNIIAGNLESNAVTQNPSGSYSFPSNKQGAVFYNSSAQPILTIDLKTINNILSNYSNGKIKK